MHRHADGIAAQAGLRAPEEVRVAEVKGPSARRAEPTTAQQVLGLQRAGGNRATAAAISLQRKPTNTVITDTAHLRKVQHSDAHTIAVSNKKKGPTLEAGQAIEVDPEVRSPD